MSLGKHVKFTKSIEYIHCLPTEKHCRKGPKASASIATMDLEAIGMGLKKFVEVYDMLEKKMYVFDAQQVMKLLYYCGSSDFMAFMYKAVKPLEVR